MNPLGNHQHVMMHAARALRTVDCVPVCLPHCAEWFLFNAYRQWGMAWL